MNAADVRRLAERGLARPAQPRPARRRGAAAAIAFLVYLSLAVVLQLAGGCYRAEFDGYPDESAHYITGLMVHDYYLSGSLLHPLTYAENYYLHYPKVAFGHWPPGFYILQSVWMLLFSPARASMLLLMAAITAAAAAVMFAAGRKEWGAGWAAGAGAVFVCAPVVQANTGMVMAESLLALCGLLAAVSFGRFVETGAVRDAVWFGAWSAVTILVKGNGWAVLLPPLALALSGRWRLLFGWPLWAGAVVAALVVPWQVATMHMVQEGWVSPWGTAYTRMALPELARLTEVNLGWGLTALAVAGLGFEFVRPWWKGRRPSGLSSALASLALAVWLFHAIVPASVEDRRIVLGLSAVILLAAAGASQLGRLWKGRLVWAVAAAAAGSFALEAFTVPVKPHDHFAEAAAAALAACPSPDDRLFVAGSGSGEGAFIAEVAMREKRPGHFVLRASKMFADTDWENAHMAMRYQTVAEAEDRLEAWGVNGLAIEEGGPMPRYVDLTRQVLDAYADRWKPVALPADCAGHARLFRFTGARRARPAGFEVDLRRMLGRTLSSE